MILNNIWDFKLIQEKDRKFQNIEMYSDTLTEMYSYDSNVPNHKNVKVGDVAIIRDKQKVLGVAKIEEIKNTPSFKIIKYCPTCNSYEISLRKNKRPLFRCVKCKSEFDKPNEVKNDIASYSAKYGTSFRLLANKNISINKLKPFYLKYNPTNSIQSLDLKALDLIEEFDVNLKNAFLNSNSSIAYNENSDENFSFEDEREIVIRQIKARRGQEQFRNKLRKRYGDMCMVTGSTLSQIIEAAHIKPYRGEKDNVISNGLLLRADIHTLYDLNLIGIEPTTMQIHIHENALKEYGVFHKQTIRNTTSELRPSKKYLKLRWHFFEDEYMKKENH